MSMTWEEIYARLLCPWNDDADESDGYSPTTVQAVAGAAWIVYRMEGGRPHSITPDANGGIVVRCGSCEYVADANGDIEVREWDGNKLLRRQPITWR